MTYGTPKWRPWVLDEEASRPFIKRALEHGINFFDTADMYSLRRQRRGGRPRAQGLREAPRGRHRDEGLRAIDGAMPNERGLSRKHIMDCDRRTRCSGSAWTTSTSTRSIAWTMQTPIEETLEALNDVVRAGKARYIGASSMYAWQFAQMALHAARRDGWAQFVSMQNHYNLVYREEEREMIPLCREPGHRPDALEPAGTRIPRRQSQAGREERDVTRAERRLWPQPVLRRRRLRHCRSRRRGRQRQRCAARFRLRWRGCSASPASSRRS